MLLKLLNVKLVLYKSSRLGASVTLTASLTLFNILMSAVI